MEPTTRTAGDVENDDALESAGTEQPIFDAALEVFSRKGQDVVVLDVARRSCRRFHSL